MNIADTSDTKRTLIALVATVPLALGLLASIYAATGLIG